MAEELPRKRPSFFKRYLKRSSSKDVVWKL
jgi:hypothetical protein